TLSVRAARLCSRRRAMCRGFPAATLTSLRIQASSPQDSSPWNSTDAIVWLILCSAGALARGFWLVCDTAVHPASYSNLLVSLSSREKRERVLRASASRSAFRRQKLRRMLTCPLRDVRVRHVFRIK